MRKTFFHSKSKIIKKIMLFRGKKPQTTLYEKDFIPYLHYKTNIRKYKTNTMLVAHTNTCFSNPRSGLLNQNSQNTFFAAQTVKTISFSNLWLNYSFADKCLVALFSLESELLFTIYNFTIYYLLFTICLALFHVSTSKMPYFLTFPDLF